jgi:hypothetical protein
VSILPLLAPRFRHRWRAATGELNFQTRNHVITQRRKDAKMTENEMSVQQFSKVHTKQVFTYLKLKGLKLGFVLNFGPNLMKEGIERVVNGLSEENLCVCVLA